MATVRMRVPTQVYLQCPIWDCEGNEQVRVDGWVEEHVRTRRELQAENSSGDDRSTMVYGTGEDLECPACAADGKRTVRMVVGQERPSYPRLVQDKEGLGQEFLKALKDGRIKPKQEDSGEMEAMRSALEDARREMAELKGFVAGQQQAQPVKRGPGRPPKTEE